MQGVYDWTNRYANDALWGGLDNFNAHMEAATDLPTLRAPTRRHERADVVAS